MTITSLSFIATDSQGDTYDEVFEVNTASAETALGLYSMIAQYSLDLVSDCLLAKQKLEAKLREFSEVEDYDSFEVLAKQIQRAEAFFNSPVTVSFETKSGRGAKKVVAFAAYKKGLKGIVLSFVKSLEGDMLTAILAGQFKPNGLEIFTDLVNENIEKLIPTVKGSSKLKSIQAMYNKYISDNASNVVEMTTEETDDDDFEGIDDDLEVNQ